MPEMTQTVEVWGSSLVLRIAAHIAKAANMANETEVNIEVIDGGIFIRPQRATKMTLEQKVGAFDPATNGGEFMPSEPVGAETNSNHSENR